MSFLKVLKVSLCIFSLLVFVSCEVPSTPAPIDDNELQSPVIDSEVVIVSSDQMTLNMQTDAVNILKKALDKDADNPCIVVRDYFDDKYTESEWHCVEYSLYAVHRNKAVAMKVGNRHFFVYATVKS